MSSPIAVPEKLTSTAFSVSNPPKDWCDAGLLIPHESIRHEMKAMQVSVEAMDTKEAWRLVYFAEWFLDCFYPCIHGHHDNEEDIYFPWIATRAKFPEKLAKDHTELVRQMNVIKTFCVEICRKKGQSCADEVKGLKDAVPVFVKDMSDHLKEEEEMVPAMLREHFTQKEEEEIIQKILAKEGLAGCRFFVPSILKAMEDWAKPEFRESFFNDIPNPIHHLVVKYYIPDYNNVVVPMRDAPLLKGGKPKLSKVGCCGLPCCFACVV